MELTVVPIVKPDDANFIFGQSHITGILRGSRTNVRCRAISGRSSVTVKKKRSAATEPLMPDAPTPVCI